MYQDYVRYFDYEKFSPNFLCHVIDENQAITVYQYMTD